MGKVGAAALLVLAPKPLGQQHDVERFSNGKHPSLDIWLREKARASEGLSARTYVVCPRSNLSRVVGYFSISTALEQRQILPSAKLRKGSPDHVPLLLIGRLAVDQEWRGKGLGTALLADALKRCLAASQIAGVRAVVTHAIDDAAVTFYLDRGFILSPLGERVLLMPIETVRALVG